MGGLLFILSYKYLIETVKVEEMRLNLREFKALSRTMLKDSSIWTSAILIGASNGIIFSFWAEAPFIFIEELGFSPALYGTIGIVVSVASILSSILSRCLLRTLSSDGIITIGALIIFFGSISLLMASFLSLFWLKLGFILSLLIIFFGIGLLIPNVLSRALINYSSMLGSAASILGILYYLIIALLLGGMSFIHNGTLWVMPIYFFFLSALMLSIFLDFRGFFSQIMVEG